MNDHPDIEELSAVELSAAVSAHMESCQICISIRTDMLQFDVELKSLNEPVYIPGETDKAVFENITLRSRQIKKFLFRRNLLASLSAVAAVIAVSFIVLNSSSKNVEALSRVDVNGDGHVNVLDSFILAQRIEAASTNSMDDINGDGKINSEDLQIVRNYVVSLDGRKP